MQSFLDEMQFLLNQQKELGLIGIKSEFESEGVRISEFNTITSLAQSLNLFSALKIGGAEAKSDMYISIERDCKYIISPMIETPYAALKCISAYKEIILDKGYTKPYLLLNIETKTALANAREIIDVIKPVATGVVFGRVDFSLSSGLSRNDISCDYVNDAVISVSSLCHEYDLEFVLGGGISVSSVPLLEHLRDDYRLDRFETRKCVLSKHSLNHDINTLLKDCVSFELLWLKFKRSLYTCYSLEDSARINMLEHRLLHNINGCQ